MSRVRALDAVGRRVRVRFGVVGAAMALGLGLLVAGGFQLMIAGGDDWRAFAAEERERRLRVIPKRGTVYDRNGSALAVSVEVPSVSLDAVEAVSRTPRNEVPAYARAAAAELAAVLDLDVTEVERKLLSGRRFHYLKRRITSAEAEGIRQLSTREDSPIRGLRIEGEARRYYPRRELAAPMLGFVAPDGHGKDGFELAWDPTLTGHVELLSGLRDRRGRLLLADGVRDQRALAGHDVELSVDQGIQFVAERALEQAARTYEAAGGSVVVIDPRSGEILAMASWPSYNPNDYRFSEPEARRNRAVTDVFEPGSTMKIFTIAAGLQTKVVGPTDTLHCENGFMRVDDRVIRDTHPVDELVLPQVLAQSSNICSAKIGLAVGGERLYEWFRAFGFGQQTGVPLPGERSGTLRPKGHVWFNVDTASASFGQGIGVTNLQLAVAAAAIANGGLLMEPVLVRRVRTADGEVIQESAPRERRRVIPETTARLVAEMMVAVTEDGGTGTSAAIPGFAVAGKTGTAQKYDHKSGGYSADAYVSSFVGFVPARDPVVVVAVMIDEPMVDHAGGTVAAPVFRAVAKAVLDGMGVTPRRTEPVDLADIAHRADPAQAVSAMLDEAFGAGPTVQETAPGALSSGEVRVPNLTGLPAREALRQLHELGLAGELSGTGSVTAQIPSPGAALAKGAVVQLVFSPAS